MKKLLITTMAAVSVGLCAKAADDGFISGTSFETVPEKSYLATNGETTLCNWYGEAGSVLSDDYSTDPELRGRYWMTEATDAQLVVSNVTNFAGDYLSTDNRPQQWRDGDNTKALYIDTDKPLMRYVNPSTDGGTAAGADLDQDIFFDSVVQFTATDVAAQPDTADKLRVWLYTSPDDVGTTPGLFSETTPKTCLVVTAGKYDGELSTSNLKAEHYEVQIDGVELQPDTWHRLTIKAIADIDPTEYATPGFEIWVDGKPVTYGADKKTQFPSLKEAETSGKETLQCVAFDGKGAVDDIVFTTTAPEFAKEPEAQKFVVTLNYESSDKLTFQNFTIGTESVTASNGGTYEIPIGAEFSILLSVESGYTLSIQENIELLIPTIDQRGRHNLTFTPTAVGTGTIEIKVNAASDGVTYPTVKPEGDGAVITQSLSDNANKAIQFAFAGVSASDMPTELTVYVNGEKYVNDEAIKMINEAVEMFTLADGAKFFDEEGVMEISFKATGADPEAVAYEAKVGGLTATVNETSYEVVPKYIDIATNTELTAKPEGTVTFRLVIQKK